MFINSRRIDRVLQKHIPLVIGAALALVIVLHSESYKYFFFQDDFFHLRISQANYFLDFFKFFQFREDIIGYRPVSIQTFFFLSRHLFDLNPLGFRLLLLMQFVLSSVLIFLITEEVSKNRKIAYLTSFLWTSSSIHFMAFSWVSAGYNIIGAFFYLLSFYLFAKFFKSKKALQYFFATVCFLISICSFEFATTLPLILVSYLLLIKKINIKRTTIYTLIIFFITFVYLILRSLYKANPLIVDYQLSFNLESAVALWWYVLWSFNIPEEFKYQVTNQFLRINQTYYSYFPQFITVTYIKISFLFLFAIVVPIFSALKSNVKLNFRLITFASIWFLAAIFPALLIPKHTFPMYLTLSSVGLYILIAYMISKYSNFLLTCIIIGFWIWSSISATQFTRKTSYMKEAQQIASTFYKKTKSTYPYLPKNSTVLYELHDTHIHALGDQSAIKTIYQDETLKIYYSKSDLLDDYKNRKVKSGLIYVLD